jgi:mono/diheme cytochrome c family protein
MLSRQLLSRPARLVITALVATMATLVITGGASPGSAAPSDRAQLERGRFLVAYGGCNECHTPGWRDNDGNVPPTRWMTGSTIGFRGPWGTIYPTNVRLWFQVSTEADWLQAVETRAGHPPMKWIDLRALSIADRRAIYRFIRALGPAGVPAPNDVPPGREPTTPYIDVVPKLPAGPHAPLP